jgi:hypothetical protein
MAESRKCFVPNTLSGTSICKNYIKPSANPNQLFRWTFRLVQQFMTLNKLKFQTFTLPEKKSLKVAIKGIPFDITDKEVLEELYSIGFEPNYVRDFQKDSKRLPIHMVSLKSTENAKDILKQMTYFAFILK